MSKIEKLFKKPKIKKYEILSEDLKLFEGIFPDKEVSGSKRVELVYEDTMTKEPEIGEDHIDRKLREIFIYKGEEEDGRKVYVIEYSVIEGEYGYPEDLISEVVDDDDELESIVKEDSEPDPIWIEDTITRELNWFVIPTINPNIVKQIVPYVLENIK